MYSYEDRSQETAASLLAINADRSAMILHDPVCRPASKLVLGCRAQHVFKSATSTPGRSSGPKVLPPSWRGLSVSRAVQVPKSMPYRTDIAYMPRSSARSSA